MKHKVLKVIHPKQDVKSRTNWNSGVFYLIIPSAAYLLLFSPLISLSFNLFNKPIIH